MARNVFIKFSDSSLDYARLALQDVKNGFSRATKNAINSSLAATRKELYQAIRDRYALRTPKSEENKATNVMRAKNEPYSGMIKYSSKALPTIKFKTFPAKPLNQKGKRISQRKKVVTEIMRSQPKQWPHAFIVKMQNGHIGVYTRTGQMVDERSYRNSRYGKTKKGKHINREGIRQRFSPDVPQMINTVLGDDKSLQARISAIADVKLNEQIKKLLAKG